MHDIPPPNDHGIYIKAASNVIVRRNVIFDTNRGWPIHVYKSGGTTTNIDIYHNTFCGRSATGKPDGHILLADTVNGANIKNNISTDAQTGMVNMYSLSASNVVVSNNLSGTLEKTGLGVAGVTFSNNIRRSTNLGFVDKLWNDFRLHSKVPPSTTAQQSEFPLSRIAYRTLEPMNFRDYIFLFVRLLSRTQLSVSIQMSR